MAKLSSEPRNNSTLYKPKQHPRKIPLLVSLFSPKLLIYIVAVFVILFIVFQSLQHPWHFMHHLQNQSLTITKPDQDCTQPDLKSVTTKLQNSVTFLPLKDLRYANKPWQDHTWFMSSFNDTREKGEAQFQEYPSKASNGRVLCLKGRDNHDGSWNSYGLAWREALPLNSTFMKGTTFVSYNHYNYDNIWHGLSAVLPFVSWHVKNECQVFPTRWVLYHWGELRSKMGLWLSSVTEATFGKPLNIETFQRSESDHSFCFEKAVVMRHNEGGMSRDRRLQAYDLLRCKTRVYCNVSLEGRLSDVNENGLPVIRLTMFMRTGPRSFQNQTAVMEIFNKSCLHMEGCRFMVVYVNNLTFCEQVKVMSLTDVLVSPHGAQLTNMFLMDRNSSVLEFFPKGWLKLAGVGQYVYHWIASWSGMIHHGAWRDPGSTTETTCSFPDDDRRCMSIYKNARIGHNETYFYQWARDVLMDVRLRKGEESLRKINTVLASNSCRCIASS